MFESQDTTTTEATTTASPNAYEQRRAARIERLKARAARATAESNATYNRARTMASVIPFGQPILVGHHSERRDRNYRGRITSTFEKSFELAAKAEHYADRAAAAESNDAISSDDPAAISKLRDKLAALEAERAEAKADNAKLRKAKLAPAAATVEALTELGISQPHAAELASTARVAPYQMGATACWPGYSLQNLGANIRRVAQRIAELERRQVIAAKAVEAAGSETITTRTGNGWQLVEDIAENRICFVFDGKPDADIRHTLKRNGFRWSPSRTAWVRMLNAAGRWSANKIGRAHV